jgi:hypothetical protein
MILISFPAATGIQEATRKEQSGDGKRNIQVRGLADSGGS